MSRRRSRFTVDLILKDGKPHRSVVLAYSADDVRTRYHLPTRGQYVLDVKAGDYRKQQRAAEIKAQGGYRVDQRALRAAIETLGLKLPVKIRYNGRVGQTNGNYTFRGGYHDIMLKTYHTADQASSTLWHELTHAMQSERVGGTLGTWAEYRKGQRRYTYRQRPMEVEARRMSAKMSHIKLCVPTN